MIGRNFDHFFAVFSTINAVLNLVRVIIEYSTNPDKVFRRDTILEEYWSQN